MKQNYNKIRSQGFSLTLTQYLTQILNLSCEALPSETLKNMNPGPNLKSIEIDRSKSNKPIQSKFEYHLLLLNFKLRPSIKDEIKKEEIEIKLRLQLLHLERDPPYKVH